MPRKNKFTAARDRLVERPMNAAFSKIAPMPVARGEQLNLPLPKCRTVARLKYQRAVIVALEGGLVSSVCSHDDELIGRPFTVIDYDIDAANDADLSPVLQRDGGEADAIVWSGTIEKATVKF
jgi:hypothetical protein